MLTKPLVPGYGFSVREAKIEGGQRIRFTASSTELYRDWCAMQQTYHYFGNPTEYWCVPGYAISSPDPNSPPTCFAPSDPDNVDGAPMIDCGHAETCVTHCVCDASGCIAPGGEDVLLDATLRDGGEALQGTLVIGASRIVVRMTRM
jgi:hypothetical protein